MDVIIPYEKFIKAVLSISELGVLFLLFSSIKIFLRYLQCL